MGGLPPFSCFCDGGLTVLFENQGHQRNEIRKQSCGILICTVPKTAARTKTRECMYEHKRKCAQKIELIIIVTKCSVWC